MARRQPTRSKPKHLGSYKGFTLAQGTGGRFYAVGNGGSVLLSASTVEELKKLVNTTTP